METIYTIHNNFDHCSVDFNDRNYSYHKLVGLLKERGENYIKKNKLKPKSISILLDKQFDDFEKSNLSDEELKEYEYLKKKSKGKSWVSSQRNLRRKGKLKQHQIDMLNQRGMLWNPTVDEWEKNYDKFRKKILVDVLLKMRNKEYGFSNSLLIDLKKQENWINEQRELFNSSKLDKENLIRLKAIDFPFKPAKDENHKINLYELVHLIYRIKTLKEELYGSRNDFVKFYKLPRENKYIGSKIKINESTILLKRKERSKKEKEESEQFDLEWKTSEERAQKDAQRILNSKPKPLGYFIKQIDKICRKRGSSLWDTYTRQNVNYSDLSNFLDNFFYFPRTTIKNVVYRATWVEYAFDDEIKIYAAEKMLMILDKYLLKTGRLNHKKRFKPISFLLAHYKKEKNITGLLWLSEFIGNHQLLTLIYGERIEKICKNLKSIRNFERPE